jgi:hypothetical protein
VSKPLKPMTRWKKRHKQYPIRYSGGQVSGFVWIPRLYVQSNRRRTRMQRIAAWVLVAIAASYALMLALMVLPT